MHVCTVLHRHVNVDEDTVVPRWSWLRAPEGPDVPVPSNLAGCLCLSPSTQLQLPAMYQDIRSIHIVRRPAP